MPSFTVVLKRTAVVYATFIVIEESYDEMRELLADGEYRNSLWEEPGCFGETTEVDEGADWAVSSVEQQP